MSELNLQRIKRPSVPLHAEVTDLLRHQILSGHLPAGARLPPLSELSERLGVAKMTVRQAMDSLEKESLIERHVGRGTFVRHVQVRQPQVLRMHADIAQLQKMVGALKVTVAMAADGATEDAGDTAYVRMQRIHSQGGEPFCIANLRLLREIYELAPARFDSEIVIKVLQDLGVKMVSAKQRVTISYADVDAAEVLDVPVNSPVMRVVRAFHGSDKKLIYTAELTYPGDALCFEIDFDLPPGPGPDSPIS